MYQLKSGGGGGVDNKTTTEGCHHAALFILDAICHFAIADPMYCYEFPHEYQQRVKETHENGGGYGSMGSVAAARL